MASVPQAGLVFVDNASGAVNAVLRSLLFDATSSDVVIYFHTVYGMVRTVMQYLSKMTGVTVVQANVTLPIATSSQATASSSSSPSSSSSSSPLWGADEEDAYIRALQPVLEQYGARVKMVIFSHISSVPGILWHFFISQLCITM
jgi:hypothetical protein